MKFEKALVKSAEISNGVYVDALLRRFDGSEHCFSDCFEKRIEKLKHRAEHPYVRRVLRSAASIVLAILVTSAVWLTVDTQARAAFIGWVKGYCETWFVYQFTGAEEEVQTPKHYNMTWVPDGCSELMKTDDGATFTTVYLDSQGHYLKFYYAMPGDAVWYVDVDNTTKEDAEVNGCPADLHIANDSEHGSALMWTDINDTAFCIAGYFTPDELLKMADSVEELSASVEETVAEAQLQMPKDYHLTWVPSGYSELMKTDTGGTISTVYVDAQGQYLKFHYITQSQPDETYWYFVVSHTTRQDAEVNGYPADLFIANSAEHASALMWTDKDDTAFCISGYLTPEELFRLADSIEAIE